METQVVPLQYPQNTNRLAQYQLKNGLFAIQTPNSIYRLNLSENLPKYWQKFLLKIFKEIGGLRLVPFPKLTEIQN